MVRTAIVTVIAVCLTLGLLSLGTFVFLQTTEFGKVAMGHPEGVRDPWKTFMAGENLAFLYLLLPVTVVISFLAAICARRWPVPAGIVGTGPAWAVLLAAGDLLRGFILVVLATAAASWAAWWRKGRAGKASSNALAAKHSN